MNMAVISLRAAGCQPLLLGPGWNNGAAISALPIRPTLLKTAWTQKQLRPVPSVHIVLRAAHCVLRTCTGVWCVVCGVWCVVCGVWWWW